MDMFKKVNSNIIRKKKHKRIRFRIKGTPERPRLNVFRSASNIYAQIIDDISGATLVSASTVDKDVKGSIGNGGNIEAASAIGKQIAKKAIEKGIKEVVFDRGGYIYSGRVKALADAAREEGLAF
jgi:large subunit ribosomal protein L18